MILNHWMSDYQRIVNKYGYDFTNANLSHKADFQDDKEYVELIKKAVRDIEYDLKRWFDSL
jgi:hypothetical protein